MSSIYLIDDHLMMRDGLRAVLAAHGHQVVGESDQPTQALDELRRLQPQVLLLDLHLGEHTGFEVLSELQRRRSGTRVIVLSMSAQPRHVAEALRLGVMGYVLKGAPSSELLDAIDKVLIGQRFLGQEVADLAVQGLIEPDSDDRFHTLSARERQIVQRVVRGQSSTTIGEALHLSPKTVDTYRSRLMAKLGVGDLPALVRLAIRSGLIDAQEP